MTQSDHNPVWKWLGVILVVLLCLFALKIIVLPFFFWVSGLVWWIAGGIAVILKVFIYIFLLIAAVLGILMLIAWIIRQFIE